MKNNLLSLLLAFAPFIVKAQWTNDPSNPLLVSDQTNYQNGPQSQSDGQGGAYIFWMDDRATFGKKEVYGQHVDANGNDMWEEGGRLILTDTKDIEWFRFYRYASDGKMIISWYAADDGGAIPEDKVWVQELDNEGAKVWANDLAISEESPDGVLSVGYFINIVIKRDALGFQVCMMITTYGYNRIRMSRFSEEGSLLMQYNGVEIGPLSFGNVSMTSDGGTGAYIYYSTGNGSGAALMCMHVDAYGASLWSDWVSVADANGLSYQFSASGDDTGVTFVWQGNGINVENLYARRLNADGTFAWSGNSVNICVADGAQTTFSWIRSGSDYYITWADGRPGVAGFYAIYAQKFNMMGEIGWADNGIMVADLPTYSPTPRITNGLDGFLYISHISTVHGYVFQKLSTDGELQWDAIGEQVAINSFVPNGNERTEFISANNLLSAWVIPLTVGGADGIYINRVADLTPVTIIQESVTSCGAYVFEDVAYTESGLYEIEVGQDSLLQLDLTILNSTTSELFVEVCESYELNGLVYEESGSYMQVIENSQGCDSIISLQLTISTVNDGITLDGTTLTATQAGAQYEWIDCNTGESVGTNSQTFTPTVSGSYQVQVVIDECESSSECITVTVINVLDQTQGEILIYPNPFSDYITISSQTGEMLSEIMVSDITGRLVKNVSVNSVSKMIETDELAAGQYMLMVHSLSGIYTYHLVKQ
jgi:Secretion system C-terminal sorting domain